MEMTMVPDVAKKRLTRRRLLQAAGGLVLAGLAPEALAAEAALGEVSDLRGSATARRKAKRRDLDQGASVFLGETLITAKRSRLTAVLAGKTTLRLGAETSLRLDRFIAEKGGELVLGNGALLLDTPARKPGSGGVVVRSPFALIAVRGTRYFAGPIDGIFGVFVERGSVNVTAGGRTVRLRAGDGTDIRRAGDPPGPVRRWGRPKIAKAMALVN
jgi:ferric-dicitrate binding protein FerR (iron transport regulator)